MSSRRFRKTTQQYVPGNTSLKEQLLFLIQRYEKKDGKVQESGRCATRTSGGETCFLSSLTLKAADSSKLHVAEEYPGHSSLRPVRSRTKRTEHVEKTKHVHLSTKSNKRKLVCPRPGWRSRGSAGTVAPDAGPEVDAFSTTGAQDVWTCGCARARTRGARHTQSCS